MAAFHVRYDRLRRRLHWSMHGLWTMQDVVAFTVALRDAVAPLGPPPQKYDGLCDASDFPVQTNEVSNALGFIDAMGEKMRDGRLAVVVASSINKLQVNRTLASAGMRAFLALEEAQQWLDAGHADD